MKPRIRLILCSALTLALFRVSPVLADDEFITLESSDYEAQRHRAVAPAYPYEAGSSSLRPLPQPYGSGAAVTLRRRAENVALAVALVNESRQAEARNRELLDTLVRLVERAEATPGIRIHNGRIALSTRDRKMVSFGSTETRTNLDIYVLATLPEDKSALEVTNTIKQFLSAVQPVGQTRIIEGSVGLSIKEPERFRPELVVLIVDDVHFVSEKLGGKVKVAITGLDRPLSVRQRNDTEVELLIPYSYSIEYVRE